MSVVQGAMQAALLREYQSGMTEGVQMTLNLLLGNTDSYPGAIPAPQEAVSSEVREWAEQALLNLKAVQ